MPKNLMTAQRPRVEKLITFEFPKLREGWEHIWGRQLDKPEQYVRIVRTPFIDADLFYTGNTGSGHWGVFGVRNLTPEQRQLFDKI